MLEEAARQMVGRRYRVISRCVFAYDVTGTVHGYEKRRDGELILHLRADNGKLMSVSSRSEAVMWHRLWDEPAPVQAHPGDHRVPDDDVAVQLAPGDPGLAEDVRVAPEGR